ncbi:hypothetical protein MKEN_01330700 [Mycena kentingensis (nom. inval.)]|nr:hypothetical protein MKEN_01330700 [Mycena kentingensis (nom. inval.)]
MSASRSPPVLRYPHPFHQDPGEMEMWGPDAWESRTLVELAMCRLSATIRQKPRWWEKIRDSTLREKWIKEAEKQQKDLWSWETLSDNMLNYVMSELETYAELRDAETGIQHAQFDCIYMSDSLIPPELAASLSAAVAPLENVPDTQKDWHPGSEQRVLDLVHPSICPLIFGQSWGTNRVGSQTVFNAPSAKDLDVDAMFVSARFQWLPSDFVVSERNESGAVSVKLESSYINNVPPEHASDLIPVIEQVMARAVPLWERVLSSLREPQTPARVPCHGCIWPDEDRELAGVEDGESCDYEDLNWIERKHGDRLVLPDAPKAYRPVLRTTPPSVSLAGSTLQVIVKLANIVLTPEKPDYPGGVWHVEGMATESIVSTFIYYHDCANIEPADLRFRMAICWPDSHYGQNDFVCPIVMYGLAARDPCVQEIGSIQTLPGRAVAFPNLYQHQVSPFRLQDATKPGTRKILVFFLVDPTVKVPSASNVAPQQAWFMREILLEIARDPGSRLGALPVELIDLVADVIPGTMTREAAEAVREELMEERSIMIQDVDKEYFSREFNMCEH